MNYSGMRVLVTGGLGFIGSNLVLHLASAGAHVTVIDSAVLGCGANEFNVQPVQDRVIILRDDIANLAAYRAEIEGTQVVFNMAGEISHINSMRNPLRDLELNTISQLKFLLALRDLCPGVRIVYASTRQVYGVPQVLPINESHPVNPIDFNGVNKNAASSYHRLMSVTGDLDATVLRLTNVYGPRMALHIPEQGVLGHFFRRALVGEDLEVFGDGQQLRDPVYIDDVLDAILLAGSARQLPHMFLNVGGLEALRLADVARILADAGGCSLLFREFPEGSKSIDIGSYSTDSTLIRQTIGWKPRVDFAEGARRTLAFFRQYASRYLRSEDAARCRARMPVLPR